MNTRIQAACEAAAERWDVPAMAVGVSVDGREWVVALGCDPAARFRIASVTKPMTAALCVELLELEATSGLWPDDVRVRHLLSHTSGFDCELVGATNADFGDGDDALARCVATLGSVRRFVGSGEAWSYANTGYWLAGFLAAERAGTTFEDALGTHVLVPAGLEATAFDEPDLEGTGADAVPGLYPRSRRPSGGLVSNVADVLRFGRWHLRARDAQRVVHGKPVGGVYGLGVFGERVGGVDVWGHGGSFGGFQSSFLTVPSHDAVFVGLTNASKGAKALAEVEDVFFDEVMGARRRVARHVKPDEGELAQFVGEYENSNERVRVEDAGDGLVLHREDGEHIGLKIGPRTFRIPVGDRVDERFDFPLDGFGRFGSRLAARVA